MRRKLSSIPFSVMPAVAFFSFHVAHVGLGFMIWISTYPVHSCSHGLPIFFFFFFFCFRLFPSITGFNINKRRRKNKIVNSIWCKAFYFVLSLSCLAHWLGLYDLVSVHSVHSCFLLLCPLLFFLGLYISGFMHIVVFKRFAALAPCNSLAYVAWLGSF